MWSVQMTDTFDEWFDTQDDIDRGNILASLLVLQERGPMLSRPYADSVKGSDYSNMKELRVQSKGEPIRVFLRLILCEKEFCFVLETKLGMKNVFMKR